MSQNKIPFSVTKSDNEVVKLSEKVKIDSCKNKKLIETKIFDEVTMYTLKNKKLEEPLNLSLLPSSSEAKKNSQKLVNKISLVLETEKQRKDLKIAFEEDMDKQYNYDIREIINDMDSKGRKNYDDKNDIEVDGDPSAKDATKADPNNPNDPNHMDTGDVDDITSIDSDTKEEEKKFKVHDNVIKTNTVDTTKIEHAK